MATYREMVYMTLDLLKERSDDAFYTEEHVLFLLSKMRALLLERKYKNSSRATYSEMSDENRQTICIDLEATQLDEDACGPMWLRSTKKLPDTLGATDVRINSIGDMVHSMITFIPIERMPYVGYNKWLRNIIYAAKSTDGYLYLYSNNPQFIYLDGAKISAVFSSPYAAENMSCGDEGDSSACDIMDKNFPLEESLILSCIELTVQELSGARYTPEDRSNNARDEFGTGSTGSASAARPAERIRSAREARDARAEREAAARNNNE